MPHRLNHIDDADLTTLRNINGRLYDAVALTDPDRRELAKLMRLILNRVEAVYIEVKEPEHG
jgi:hypothetical protein